MFIWMLSNDRLSSSLLTSISWEVGILIDGDGTVDVEVEINLRRRQGLADEAERRRQDPVKLGSLST